MDPRAEVAVLEPARRTDARSETSLLSLRLLLAFGGPGPVTRPLRGGSLIDRHHVLHAFTVLGLYGLLSLCIYAVARASGRRLPWWVISTAVLLPILLVWPCVFSGLTPLPVDHALSLPPWSNTASVARYNESFNDAITQIAPWQKAVRQAWKEGGLPFWNRWNGCGMPLAATGQSEAFSPFTFLMFPLPLAHGFTLLVLAKLLLAFCGMWLWLAEMGVSRMAAVVGATLFGFSLSMTGWLLFPLTSVLCLWPWALFGFEVLRDAHRRSRGMILLVAVLGWWGLGHPEMAALGALLLAFWAILRESRETRSHRRRVLIAAGLAGISAVGLTAFLLLPEALAIAASNRARSAAALWGQLPFSAAPHGPLWKGYLTLLFPTSLGDGIATTTLSRLSPASFLETGLGHFGLVGWTAALCFLRPGGARRPPEWILLGLMVVGGGVALGCWPFFEVFLHLPVLRLTPPLRYLSWVSVAGSALAAFELDRLSDDVGKNRRHLVPFVLIVVVLGVAAASVFHYLTPLYLAAGDTEAHRQTLVRTETTLALAIISALGVGLAGRVRLLTPLLGIVAYLELARLGQRLYRFGSPADLYPRTPLLEFLARQPPPFRVLGEGPYVFPNSNIFPALQEIRTHDPVERRDYTDYLDQIAGYDPREYFKAIRNVDAPGLDRLNVKYLVSPPDRIAPSTKWRLVYSGTDGRVFENTHVWPRVFTRAPRNRDVAIGSLSVSEYREIANSITFTARVRGVTPVLAETSIVTDGGWHARLDLGTNLRVGKVEGTFLSIIIPAGTHQVHLDYRPPGLTAGMTLSATVAILLPAAAYALRRKQRLN